MNRASQGLRAVAAVPIMVAACALVAAMDGLAAPTAVPFLAEMTDPAGVPFDGTVDIAVRLHAHATANAPIWPTDAGAPTYATYSSVTVAQGVFSLLLGGEDSIPAEPLESTLLPAAGAWLELVVDGVTLSPRLALLSVPYALRAEQAERVGEFDAAELATLADLPDLSGYAQASALADVAFTGNYADLFGIPPTTAITSVDGLTGGTILGDVAVDGALSADAIVQAGNTVCDSSGNCGPTLADLNCTTDQVAMFNGTGWQCAPMLEPDAPCTGLNQALQWNGTAFVCTAITTQVASLGNAKGYEVRDSWGFTWDGLQRAPAPWAVANATCLALGGRLPTASELYRVSAIVADEVGNPSETQVLWSRTPWASGQHATVRLDTGASAGITSTSAQRYRCVWPNVTPDVFVGNSCMGPPGDECWPVVQGNGSLSIDTWDRPSLTYMGAQDECLFYHAHIPFERELIEQITNGLPNGTDEWVFTPDTAGGSSVNIVKWSGIDPSYSDYSATYTTRSDRTTARRFRCIGQQASPGTYPNLLPDAYEIGSTHLVADALDRPVATYATAVSACFELGGHLPYDRDIVELVRGGLPNGSYQYLWTADAYTNTSSIINRWTGVFPEFAQGSTERTGASRASATGYGYRCVYYPLDSTVPPPTQCNFGCFSSQKGGVVPTRMWIDNVDRVPAPFVDAVKACHSQGGHLASLRDYTELVRAGLGNGSNAWLWSTDQVTVDTSYGNNVIQVRWIGTNSAFDAVSSTVVRARTKVGTELAAYRCVWTNEIP